MIIHKVYMPRGDDIPMAKTIGIIGSGVVGQQLALGFLKAGDEVVIGTRDPKKLDTWKKDAPKAKIGSFKDAAEFGEVIILCTKWEGAENAIKAAGKDHFSGKIVIDVTNPLLFEQEGKPPTLALGFPSSGGKSVQAWIPNAKVVKAFNTITAYKMTNGKFSEGQGDMPIAGNDEKAKSVVADIAKKWGWNVIDFGQIEQSYLLEAIAMVWIGYGFKHNHWTHGFKLLDK